MNRLPPTIAENNAWICEAAYEAALKDAGKAKQEGYIEVPDWLPPVKGYTYRVFGQMIMLMKPKPKLRHWLRYRFKPHWLRKWRAKRFVREMLEAQ